MFGKVERPALYYTLSFADFVQELHHAGGLGGGDAGVGGEVDYEISFV